MEDMQEAPRAILVVDNSPFGEGLLMLPAMKSLRDYWSQTFITVAASRGVCELLVASNLVDETIDLGIIHKANQGLGGSLKRLLQLSQMGRRANYDWVLDFSPGWETQAAAFWKWRTRHVTPVKLSQMLDFVFKRKREAADDHSADCASVLKQIGIRKIESRFVIPVANEVSLRFEKQLFGNRTGDASPVVVLFSTSASEAGDWSAEKFGDLARRMANNFDARIVVVDEPAEARFTRAMKPFLPPKSVSLAAPRAIEVAAAVERASVVITDERGIAKVALDAGAPVVEISETRSPFSSSTSYRAVQSSSRARVEPEAVYEAACEMIQASRTASILGR